MISTGTDLPSTPTPRWSLLFVLTLTVVCASSAWSALADGPWPMFRRDLRRSGSSPYHDPTPSTTYWKCYTGGGYSSTVIGTDGVAYVAASGTLKAVNPTGTLKWSCAIGTMDRGSPAISDDGTVYVGATDGRLCAVNSNGTLRWSFATGVGITSSPAIGPDGTIYIGSRDGHLYALNPDGTQKWAFAVGGEIHTSSPAIGADGTIYVGCTDKNLYAINPDGTRKWLYATGQAIYGSPALSSDSSAIYLTGGDGKLHAISSNGGALWNVPLTIQSGNTPSSPAVGPDGTIYVGDYAGLLRAIYPSGVEKWRFQAGGEIRSSPAVSADGTVCFGCYDAGVYAVDQFRALKWRFFTKKSIYASPSIAADGTVTVISTDGYVYGGLRGTPPPPNAPTNLAATAQSETLVRLTWQDNSSDEYGFRIERWLPPFGGIASLAVAGANVTSYNDSSALPGLRYVYRVCAYQQGGNSAFSNQAEVTLPGLAGPTDLAATAVSGTRIDLSWFDRSSGELGFKIERTEGPYGAFVQVATAGADSTSYSDVSVNPAQNYYYRVRAFDASRNSFCSNEAWAATDGINYSEISRGNTVRPQMALTFDCGISPILSTLLDVLRREGVYCTFFIKGGVAQAEPASISQLILDGHYLSNHSQTHPLFAQISDSEIIYQLTECDRVLYSLCGHRTRPYFRPPSGSRDARVLAVAESIGFRSVYWTGGGGDIGGWTVQQIIDNTYANTKNGSVMLYHASVGNTVTAMETVIPELRRRGYELVTVPEIVAPDTAQSPDGVLNPGWNMISVPIQPANPTPVVVFRGLDLNNRLYRWNKETTSLEGFDNFAPDGFGTISPDEGYWLYLDSPGTIRLSGSACTTDRHIKLPQASADPAGAWTMIGYPFTTAQELANCSVYNPNSPEPRTRSIADAGSAGWLSTTLWWWDSTTGSLTDVGIADFLPTGSQLEPWHGYWLQTNVNGLELVIPAP